MKTGMLILSAAEEEVRGFLRVSGKPHYVYLLHRPARLAVTSSEQPDGPVGGRGWRESYVPFSPSAKGKYNGDYTEGAGVSE